MKTDHTHKRRYRLRKRRLIVPAVLIALLIISGQVYETYGPTLMADNTKTFASEETAQTTAAAVSGSQQDDMQEVPKEAKVTFYAGDDSVKKKTVKPNASGGYDALPRPEKEGYEFVGWYTERTGGDLVSKKSSAELSDGNTLYARWQKTSTEVDQSVPGLPVLMYHWFYDTSKGDARPTTLLNNWMETSQFEKEIAGLKDADYYFPSWDEVYAYVMGEIDLPDKSIVITMDDGQKSFYKYAIPILEKHDVRGTGFLIANKLTKKKVKKYASENISLQSHTWAMHDGYGDKSFIQTLPFDEAVADLTSASAILGTSDALAYPFGYYDDQAISVCAAAGIKMAFGVSGGNVYPGMEPLALPRVRISSNQSADSFLATFCPEP
jgi:uncharacterized repeat protein (TIGR02543 family)